jgi:xanthine dehydrogenase YagR molybdenum-binding subunit
MTAYNWPPPASRKWIGQDVPRVDGPAKVAGRATYTYDVNLPGMIYGKTVRCPYAHAKIKDINTDAAAKLAGVKAVFVIQKPGTEIFWAGDDVVAIAAVDEQTAQRAIEAVVVDYTELPHLVHDDDPAANPKFAKIMEPETKGDVDTAFTQCDQVHEGLYGLPVITHCCMESHGSVVTWNDDGLTIYISTQAVSGIPAQLAQALGVPQNKIHAITPYVGGGYGAKLAADRWGIAAAHLSKLAGGVPVKMMLDRRAEQEVGGCRPSFYAKVKVGAKKDGTVLAWQSESWGTGGITGGSEPPVPYLFQVPNQRRTHTQLINNIGPARSFRGPHHPQACLATLGPLDDLSAKLGMDPVQLFLKNMGLLAARADVYRDELQVADELMGWSKRWKPRGQAAGAGPLRRGLGVSIHSWPGIAHPSHLDVTINPDGSVAVRCATQDIGTGSRTVLAIVIAETLGLTPGDIAINIGDSSYPVSAASGGSGTVGGAGSAARRASVDVLAQLFAKVAPSLGTTAERLEAAGGTVRVQGGGASLSWKEACSKLGGLPLTAHGKNPGDGKLASSGTGGVLMADVQVDVDTGVVTIVKLVAVQDCGLVVDRKTTMSQVEGCLVMGVGYALYEEKVMDQNLGRMLNPNMEFYRLAGIGDVGEVVVHLMDGPEYDKLGIIGCGEPAVISPGAAISNAVANAIGVRVPVLPLTPDRVLAALAGASS